jgi:hypothetical protein
MKQLILSGILAVFLLSACNNKKKTAQVTIEDGKEKVTIDSGFLQKQIESLQELSPLSQEELKSVLPAELMGAKGSDYMTRSAVGTGFANAEYKINDSTKIIMSLWDCGRPGGAGYLNRQYMAMPNSAYENDDEYKKPVDFNGQKALEQCQKKNNRCSFTYFGGTRFLVVLTGFYVDMEALKKAAGQLKLK